MFIHGNYWREAWIHEETYMIKIRIYERLYLCNSKKLLVLLTECTKPNINQIENDLFNLKQGCKQILRIDCFNVFYGCCYRLNTIYMRVNYHYLTLM